MKREHWSGELGATLALIGGSVGLGTLWILPTSIHNNGNALFLYIFAFLIAIAAIPISIGELILGRESQKSAILAFYRHAKNSFL